jgi:acyl-CoA reductase-like NAD-dependent aldehyde dehydrogenase
MQRYRTKIGGRPQETRAFAQVTNPYDGTLVGEVGLGSENEIQSAILSTVDGFQATRRLASHERARILNAIAGQLEARGEELARLITLESGKPIRYARAEVSRAVTTFSLAAAEARRIGGEVHPIDQQPGFEGRLCLHRRVPRGPVAAISPFNFPLNLTAHKLAPALAVGASTVLKPPAQSPLTAHVLSDIVDQAGAPPGAFNVVHCPPEVGERIVTDERIKVLSFTGSTELGWRLKALAGKKQVVLELGGNAPCIIDAGTDLERAMPRLLEACWASAGQVCIRAQRLIVHTELYEQFRDRFVALSEQVVCGDPLDERTVVGPLIEPRHVERVLDWVREAEALGAQVLTGARAEGNVVRPTILIDTRPEMRVRGEEVFGPVVVLERAQSFAEAITRANDGRYGLQAGVFTPRLEHALLAFEQLEFGAVLVNDTPMFRSDAYPFGGTKDSGFGREGVRFAMEELTEHKVLSLLSA